jgi:archaellum biogenesis protein FlaJ (TadC family)
MADIYKQSFEIFGSLIKKYPKFLGPLTAQLRRSRITTPPEHWAAFAILAGLLAFATSIAIGMLFAIGLQLGFMAIALVPLISVGIGLGALGLTYFYPSIVADERKKRVENAIAFGTLYLAALARAGFPLPQMFKMMAGFKEYGELSREAGKISNDIDALGLDVTEAITRAIRRSPSSMWSELLVGLKTTITVGGDLAKYLDEKAKGFIDDYKRRLSEFSEFLSMLIEIYITLVVVGIIFFIVITSVMSSIGAVPVALLKTVNLLIVVIGIPVLTAMFILIAKGVSPLED